MVSKICDLANQLTEILKEKGSNISFKYSFNVDANLKSKNNYEKKALQDLYETLKNYYEKTYLTPIEGEIEK